MNGEIKEKQLYICWKNIRQRCNNKNKWDYKYYGGKGIKVCEEWNNYKNFKDWALDNGFKPGLSIDRIDTNKDYCASNCRWVTAKIQANNKSNNTIIKFKNEEKTIHQWAEIQNIPASTIRKRLERGWNVERALTEESFVGKNQTYRRFNG